MTTTTHTAGGSRIATYASFVKLPHTLFALPFAGVGAVLASYTYPEAVAWAPLAWIVIAFTAARFAAMGFNRIVDRRYDALNPRTRLRELPTGRIGLFEAVAAVLVAAALFVVAAWQLNPLCGWLSPIALVWILFYSYTKRFTSASHLVLGLALAIAPVGAYLAVAGAWPTPWYGPVLLAAGVAFWVAGFDTVYALQDVDFDQAHGLRSIPARWGARRGLSIARAFHALSLSAFLSVWALGLFPVGPWYLAGVAVVAGALAYEHWLMRGQGKQAPPNLKRIDRAFFHANVAVSMSLFLFTLLDRIVAG